MEDMIYIVWWYNTMYLDPNTWAWSLYGTQGLCSSNEEAADAYLSGVGVTYMKDH